MRGVLRLFSPHPGPLPEGEGENNTHYLPVGSVSQNVGQVSVVCVTRQAYATTLYRGQVAHTAGYGTKDVPNPPYMGYETA